ncbi:arylsulfotransferase family protein [Dongia deserti]|uniref:arylsulfotransferase family protein n=1 Tax=Dongia deserti TaxID=2268030 RepID=UPI0013C4913F|nr:arylsulfotransferase family protein [Dongia deserti]
MFDRILGRSFPAWVVVALALLFALGTVAFGWYVKRSLYLSDSSAPARAALAVASFPTMAKEVFLDIRETFRGEKPFHYVRAAAPKRELSGLSPLPSQLDVAVEGLMVRRGSGLPARGWRVLVGGLKIDGSIEDAAVLLSPDLEIVHHWLLAEEGPTNAEPGPPTANLTHGFTMLRDGSVVFNLYGEKALRRKDSCGRTMWTNTAGNYHHSVAADEAETTVWTLREDRTGDPAESSKLVQVSIADGRIEREISIKEIVAANPSIDILELRRVHEEAPTTNDSGRPGEWLKDPFHLNDINPLPRSIADKFPMFSADDLLVSARETNLIFVVNPNTLAIKWWSIGASIRQHDPDWLPSGRVSVFNNRMTRGYSEIIEIDPATKAKTVTVDGRAIDFYARGGGNHSVIPGGGWIIARGWQGTVTEISDDGSIALEFYSVLDDNGPILGKLSEALFLPEESFDLATLQCGNP